MPQSKRTKWTFFKQEVHASGTSKQKELKENCQLFAKLFISCQNRECDLQVFFHHENHQFPAALSDGGKLHACQKYQLIAVLESIIALPDTELDSDTVIIDRSCLINACHQGVPGHFRSMLCQTSY